MYCHFSSLVCGCEAGATLCAAKKSCHLDLCDLHGVVLSADFMEKLSYRRGIIEGFYSCFMLSRSAVLVEVTFPALDGHTAVFALGFSGGVFLWLSLELWRAQPLGAK